VSPVTATCRRMRSRKYARTSPRLTIKGASRMTTRCTVFGGSSNSGSSHSASASIEAFAATMFQRPSTTIAGQGSCLVRIRSSASRTGASSGSSRERSGKAGAWPAASSRWLRSRRGISSCSASSSTISGLGLERPVSTKLRCRAEIPASSASSSWLRRWRLRHSRSSGPTPGWELIVAISVAATLAAGRSQFDYLGGNRHPHLPVGRSGRSTHASEHTER
jgi:hypothetical protein